MDKVTFEPVVSVYAPNRVDKSKEIYYRYEYHYKTMHLLEFEVKKRTAAGVWIEVDYRKKFVLDNCRKQFAHPTPAEARVSFIKRREKYIEILTTRLESAKAGMVAGKKLMEAHAEKMPVEHYHNREEGNFLL